MMRKTRLKQMSEKKRGILELEREEGKRQLFESGGRCAICKTTANLEKSHTRRRDRFGMVCHACHFPGGEHKYLEEMEALR